jgi:ActR/RegA family two-component response regulator
MRTTQIFIIEDDMLSRINLEQKLKSRGQVLTAMSREEAKLKMRSKDFDLAFVDLDLDRELEGLKLITALKEKNIYISDMGQGKLRFVTHLDYKQVMHDYVLEVIQKIEL